MSRKADTNEALIAWKTSAWKDSRIVSCYQKRMFDDRGTNGLKNRLEKELCLGWARGQRILDAGCGTGRASIPLSDAGFDVTGVDSSEAMLEQARSIAKPRTIEFVEGDISRLNFGEKEFDSIVSLNVMGHFPHWRDVLEEWKRITKEKGRLIFDVHSLDHLEATRAKTELETMAGSEDFEGYFNRVRGDQLVDVANELGFSIVAVVPYGGILAGANRNHWLSGSSADGKRFERLLSWLPYDDAMFEFALFLEQQLLSRLTTHCSGRMMVVLENWPAPAGNQEWLARNERVFQDLKGNICLQKLRGLVPELDEAWRITLNSHLGSRRSLVLLHFLLSAFYLNNVSIDLGSFLEEQHLRVLDKWRSEDLLDLKTTQALMDLRELHEVSSIFEHKGIPLVGSLEYDLTREILRDYFHSFE